MWPMRLRRAYRLGPTVSCWNREYAILDSERGFDYLEMGLWMGMRGLHFFWSMFYRRGQAKCGPIR